MNSPSQKHAVELTDFKGLVVKSPDGTVIVEKLTTFADGWNASAASARAIESIDAPWKGISFMPLQGCKFMCGLASGAGAKAASIAGDQSINSLMFAAHLVGNCFKVCENGNWVDNFGHWQTGDHIEIVENAQGKIEYRVEGQVRYVSQQAIEYPLFVKICSAGRGDLLQDLCWLTRGPGISTQEQAHEMSSQNEKLTVLLAAARIQAMRADARAAAASNQSELAHAAKDVALQAESHAEEQHREAQVAEHIAIEQNSVAIERCSELQIELRQAAARATCMQVAHEVAEEQRCEAEEQYRQSLASEQIAMEERSVAVVRCSELAAELQQVEARATQIQVEKDAALELAEAQCREALAAEQVTMQEKMISVARCQELTVEHQEVLRQKEKAGGLCWWHAKIGLDASQYVDAQSTNLGCTNELTTADFPWLAFDGCGESGKRFLKIQCVGVDSCDVEVKQEMIPNSPYVITLRRRGSTGIIETTWSKRFSFKDGFYDLRQEEMMLDGGILLLAFQKQMPQFRIFRLPTQTRPPVLKSESTVDEMESGVHLGGGALRHEGPSLVAQSAEPEANPVGTCATGTQIPNSSRAGGSVWSDGSFHMVDPVKIVTTQNQDEVSNASGRPCKAKCFLINTAFKNREGHLLLVQNLKLHDEVLLSDTSVARVQALQLFPWCKKAPYDIRVISTGQGTFEVSAGHRVLTDAGEKHACDLQSGDHVWVGSKKQQVLSVTPKKQRTNLYMVSFEPDGLVELFHVPSFGLQTYGEPAPSTHHGHAPESQCVSVCSDAEEDQKESVCLNPSQLLHLIGCEKVTEEDLQGSMPIAYED